MLHGALSDEVLAATHEEVPQLSREPRVADLAVTPCRLTHRHKCSPRSRDLLPSLSFLRSEGEALSKMAYFVFRQILKEQVALYPTEVCMNG